MSAESRRPQRFKVAPSVHARLFDDELVILDLGRGEYLSLDPIGSRLWTGLEAGRTIDDVAKEIVAEYDASFERVRSDLRALQEEITARGLLVPVDGEE